MSVLDTAFMDTELSNRTSIFGLHLWVVIGIVVGAVIVLILFLLSLCVTACRRRRSAGRKGKPRLLESEISPVVSKEIQEISRDTASEQRPIVPQAVPEIQIDMGKVEHRVVFSDREGSSGESRATSGAEMGSYGGNGSFPEVSHLGWGRWYTLRELEVACNGLSDENVIGEGGYGIVYYGELADNTRVAVKNLLNNRGQAEKEFKVEVEIIGRVRHKNLVRLLGYCVEGAYRMLVYEYVDNGNLDQWLQGDVGEVSPLTWDIRVNIIIGTAKGLAYLHEGLEPKVVHRDIKSSNILLDRQWHPKLSDFGLAKLLNSEISYVTTRVMGTFGYVAPEYACTGMLTEKSDVYSFGVLIMEIITGRSPVDYSRPHGEVNLVDWLKMMVGNKKSEEVIDPKLPERPSSKALKRLLLVALRCVDPDALHNTQHSHSSRPAAAPPQKLSSKMGRVRTKTVKKSSRQVIERYYGKMTLDFHTNKKILEEVAIIPSKRLRNKIAGFSTHLMKRIQKGPVRGISLKLQEEERERRMDFVPDESAIKTDRIEVDQETVDLLESLGMKDLPGIVLKEDDGAIGVVAQASYGRGGGGRRY